MSGWVGQDFNVLMTLNAGRVILRLTPFTNVFYASLHHNIQVRKLNVETLHRVKLNVKIEESMSEFISGNKIW